MFEGLVVPAISRKLRDRLLTVLGDLRRSPLYDSLVRMWVRVYLISMPGMTVAKVE